jgi:enhancer of polycomb-like protein
MTTEDDAFLRAYNQKRPVGSKCSEDDFEKIMEVYEETAEVQAPFASVDGTVIPYDVMRSALKQQVDEKIQEFAKDVYDHWRASRQKSGNHPLQPTLKFEKNQEKDDGDPYVCFRRRDIRQTRKTRQRDMQSTDKLKKLRKELEEGRLLIAMTLQRELTKREVLKIDRNIFEQRAKVKEAKVRLGIKTDDEDLINQRVSEGPLGTVTTADRQVPQKRKPTDITQFQRPPGAPLRIPGRSDGRPLDADLILLTDLLAQKENMLHVEIEEKAAQHRKWNQGHVDLTREPLSPVDRQGLETGFRPATAQYQYLMTPPSSVTSESFDQPSPIQEKPEPFLFRHNSPPEEDQPQGQPAYRRRIGRNGRLWIDRRGMSSKSKFVDESGSDRWRYDQDDDDEQPVYELDPYDTKALRFRATIPLPPHLLPQRGRQDSAAAQLTRPIGTSPANNRATAATQQPRAPT